MSRSNRHRCEVIEVYPDHGGKAVIKMTSGRIECVGPVGDCQTFAVGQRGWVASWSPPAGTGDAMASETPDVVQIAVADSPPTESASSPRTGRRHERGPRPPIRRAPILLVESGELAVSPARAIRRRARTEVVASRTGRL